MSKRKWKKKTKFSSAEKRAYWAGVGFQSSVQYGMTGVRLRSELSDAQKKSFANGQNHVVELTSKFVPNYLRTGRKK